MDILYYGLLCDKEKYEEKLKRISMPYIIAQYTFELGLIEKLSLNDCSLKCNYIPQEYTFPKSKNLFINSIKTSINNDIKIKYLSCLNLPIIKFIWLFFSTLNRSFKYAIKGNKNEKIILSAINYSPVALSNIIIGKIFKIKNVCIFTDSIEFWASEENIKKMPFLKRVIMPIYIRYIRFLEKKYDGYIIFSKYMNGYINDKNKPNIVVEGLFNPNGLKIENYEKKSKSIMYAGSLFKQYGIGLLLDSFSLINDPDYELWLFGGGDMEEEIKECAKIDPRINFMGFMQREKIFEYEQKARLLINTRYSSDIFTKLSFPSKVFEYMVSGTPFLTTHIDGIPEEYYNYIFSPSDETPEAIKESIISIIEKSDEERKEIGLKAREFILNNKTADIQSKKIYRFLEMLLKGD